jgi:hypothetical protein
MCLVIDADCLSRVFNPRNKEHPQFIPVYKWVRFGSGRAIYGGTKYMEQLRRMPNMLDVLVELQTQRRVQVVSRGCVDAIATDIKTRVKDKALDDEHLIAIVIVSRCRIVCTDDKPAMRFIKRKALYKKYKVERPSIYLHVKHDFMCCDKNVVKRRGGS